MQAELNREGEGIEFIVRRGAQVRRACEGNRTRGTALVCIWHRHLAITEARAKHGAEEPAGPMVGRAFVFEEDHRIREGVFAAIVH